MTPLLMRMGMNINTSCINPILQTPFLVQWKYMEEKRGKSHFSVPRHQGKQAGMGGQLRHIISEGAEHSSGPHET